MRIGSAIEGHKYQHLYSWYFILDLLDPEKKVASVWLEQPDSGSVDDVIVYPADPQKPIRYYQIKWHVDAQYFYSAKTLVTREGKSKASLLEKLWRGWRQVSENGLCEIHLISNGTILPHDVLARIVQNRKGEIKETDQRTRTCLQEWQTFLKVNNRESFTAFCEALYLEFQAPNQAFLIEFIESKMRSFGLKTGLNAMDSAIAIVEEWVLKNRVKSSRSHITREDLEKAIKDRELSRRGQNTDPISTSSSHSTEKFYSKQVAPLIEHHTRVFIGREQQQVRLMHFSLEEPPGYLVVEARAGYGKTALIATLIHCHRSGRWCCPRIPSLLFYFIRKAERDQAKRFLESLNQQLLELLQIPEHLPNDIDALRRQFIGLWSEAVQRANAKAPLFLLIDGLDEIDTSWNISIVELLPRTLAPYVHVCVTSRPNPTAQDRMRGDYLHPLRNAEKMLLEEFEVTDIRLLLKQYRASAQLLIQYPERIHAMTRGSPLFAHVVCQAVSQGGEAVLAHLERNSPKDIRDYFQSELENMLLSADNDLRDDIAGLLSVTLGSISRKELAEILNTRIPKLNEAIEPLLRYFIGAERLELMHLELREALEEWYRECKSQYTRMILAWCQRYRDLHWPSNTPQYILAHYAQHLYDAGETQALDELISPTWMRAQLNHASSYRTFAGNISLVIRSLTQQRPTAIIRLVRAYYVYGTLHHLAADIPPELLGLMARIESVGKALDFAELMRDMIQQSKAYLLISYVLLERGKQQQALSLLKRARMAAESIADRRDRDERLGEIALAYIHANDLDQAHDTVALLHFKQDQIKLICQIIGVLADIDHQEQLPKVVSCAKTLIQSEVKAFPGYPDRLFSEVGGACLRVREIDLALYIMDLIHDGWEKMELLFQIILALIKAQKASEAIKLVLQLQEVINSTRDEMRGGVDSRVAKVGILRDTAAIMFELGERVLAIKVAYQGLAIAKAEGGINSMSGLISVIIQFKEMDTAERIIQELGDPLLRKHGMQEVVTRLVCENQRSRAWAVRHSVYAEWKRLHLFGMLAQAQLQTGNKRQASVLSNQLLMEIPHIMEIHVQAEKLFPDEISQDVFDVSDLYYSVFLRDTETLRAKMLSECIDVLASLDELIPSLARVPWLLSEAWYSIIQALVSHGQRDTALALLQREKKDNSGYWDTNKAVWTLLQLGEVDTALQLVQSLRSQGMPLLDESGLINTLIRRGQLDHALELLTFRQEDCKLHGMWSDLVQKLIEKECLDKAMEVAAMAGYRSGAEDIVVQSLVKVGDSPQATKFALRVWLEGYACPGEETLRLLLRAGYVEEVKARAQSISDNEARAKLLIAAVRNLVELETEEELACIVSLALEALEKLNSEQLRSQPASSRKSLTVKVAQMLQSLLLLLVSIRAFHLMSELLQNLRDQDVRNALLFELVRVSIHVGEYAYALEMARTIGDRSARIAALSDVALALAESDERRVVEIINEILVSQPLEFDARKASLMSTFAAALVRTGEIARGRCIVASLQENGVCTEQLKRVAKASVAAGRFDLAWSITQSIQHEGVQAWTQGEVAEMLVQRDEFGHALAFAQAIKFTDPRFEIYKVQHRVVAALVQKEQFDLALTIAKQISWNYESSKAVCHVAEAMIRKGLGLSAIAIADEAINEAHHVGEQVYPLFLFIKGRALVHLGRVEQALQEVEQIDDRVSRAEGLAKIGHTLLELGQTVWAGRVAKQGIALARNVENNWDIYGPLSELLHVLAEVGEFEVAIDTLPLIQPVGINLIARCKIAQALFRYGGGEGAAELVKRAVMQDEMKDYQILAYQSLDSFSMSEQVLPETAHIMIQAGKYEQLLGMLQETDARHKNKALCDLVDALVASDEFDRALRAVDLIDLPEFAWEKIHALEALAMALAQAGPKLRRKTLKCVREILSLSTKGHIWSISYILNQIIPTLSEHEGKDVACEMIRCTQDVVTGFQESAEKATLLSEVARAWDLVGRKEPALEALYAALASAYLAGRNKVLEVLEACTPLLASIENGRVLWEVYMMIQEIDSWWKTI